MRSAVPVASEHLLKVFNGPIGAEFYAKVAEKMGIVILDTGYLGTRVVGLRDVRTVKAPAFRCARSTGRSGSSACR